MKALTIRQPWASLIAAGVKTIETRSWSTKYRGPIAIHAGQHRPTEGEDVGDSGWYWEWDVDRGQITNWIDRDNPRGAPAPLGAVVATATIIDVVPIVRSGPSPRSYIIDHGPDEGSLPHQVGGLWLIGSNDLTHGKPTPVEDQRPLGDFTPGRFAWLLVDVVPLADPLPVKGRQGLWNCDALTSGVPHE